MKVFKFGGASVKDAEGVRNLEAILNNYLDSSIMIIVSAMGKTTNLLERLAEDAYNHKDHKNTLNDLINQHSKVTDDLFVDKDHPVHLEVSEIFKELKNVIESAPGGSFDHFYDQVVCTGELLSTVIISHYLNDKGIENTYLDVRELMITDDVHRDANVIWDETANRVRAKIETSNNTNKKYVTQGFIGGTLHGKSSTLGREGSDYSASIFAFLLDADEVILWKDVPGVMNADPKEFKSTTKIDQLSYYEAIEMTYYGAKVLHPKTMKPLVDKEIQLQVRPFSDPSAEGTVIKKYKFIQSTEELPPIIIRKENQVLLSIITKDYSFISEENLSQIYGQLAKYGIKVNMMQIAATSCSVIVDFKVDVLDALIDSLFHFFKVKRNDNLELLTIRHYTPAMIKEQTKGKSILLEQKTRHTIQFVIEES